MVDTVATPGGLVSMPRLHGCCSVFVRGDRSHNVAFLYTRGMTSFANKVEILFVVKLPSSLFRARLNFKQG